MDRHAQLFKQAEVETEIARGEELVAIRWMRESLRGDPSLIPSVARQIGARLVHEDHIPANERIWLALVLAKVAESPELARALSGAGRGAPRNGLKGASIAAEVLDAVFVSAISVDAAICEVAEMKHLSTDAVKKHWEANQDLLWDLYGEQLRSLGFPDLRRAVLTATTDNRKG